MSKKSAYLMAALAFIIGFGAGAAAGKKGCPPVPAPAAQPHDGPAKPVTQAPVTSGPESPAAPAVVDPAQRPVAQGAK